MAYSQQARYGAPQRPQYEQPEPLYDSAYSRGHAQSAGNQGYGYDHGYQGESAQHYPDQYGAQEDPYGYEQEGWSGSGAPHQKNDGYYPSRGQNPNRGGRPDQGQHQRRPEPAGYGPSDPRSRGGPPESRLPLNGPNGQQDRHPLREHRRPKDNKQPYDRYQNVVPAQAKGDYGYGHAYDQPQDDWQDPQNDDSQHAQHHPNEMNQMYQQQPSGHTNGYNQEHPHDIHQNVPNVRPTKAEVPASHPLQQPKISVEVEDVRQPKQPPLKRILDDVASPETVSWDNPFPSFPTKPKPNANNGLKDHTSSAHESNQRGGGGSRPHTANSKSSYGSAHNDGIIENGTDPRGGRQDGNAERLPVSRNAHIFGDHTQERPRPSQNGRTVTGMDDSISPTTQGRHSEDNRARPTIASEVPRGSGHERSHIMPIAVTNAIVNPHDEMPEVAAWQDPGATAGYHGGEDKGFLSGGDQQKPNVQSRAYSDDSNRNQNSSRFPPQPTSVPEPHTHQDSLGDYYDTYYDGTPQDVKPYPPSNDPYRRRASNDDMPNFDAAQSPNSAHVRGMTIDQHLQPQPQPPRVGQPLTSLPPQDRRPEQRRQPANTYGADPIPRSRSQPDLKDRRSPRLQNGQGFEFGVAKPGDRRPATASSNNRPGPRGQYLPGPPNERPYQDSRSRGPMQAPGQRMGDQTRGNMPYQDPRQQEGYRSPPVPNEAHQDLRQQAGYRSPPQQNGVFQDPRQQDRYRSPRQQNDPNHGPGQQDRYRSPPMQNGRPPDDRMRRPPGGPSPNNRNGPSSPPNKPLPNPDALPYHPAPVRPGLMEGSPVNSASKPPPVRQYNNNLSSVNVVSPTEGPGPGRLQESRRESIPVTYQELDKLRQKTISSPEDQATRFILAKKLVEASTVLVNERADQRTKDKVREDYISQAQKMLKKLSSNQYPEAMFYLGDCYSRGAIGLATDTKEAFTLYQSAAKANHAQAAYRVAVCCEMGQDEGGGTRKDPVKAMQWYKRAAQLGDTPAMYKMGIIQLKGLLGQPRNPREALVSLKKAAEKADRENPHALHELALLHEKGGEGVSKDEAYSKQLFVQCAGLGYKFSQFRLGCAYEYGLMGCPVDPRQSIAWYSKAAVQEEHQSELALSGWYLTGSDGVLQQSDTEAYLWARKAAQAGLAKAEYAMGYFTEVGIGAPANLEDAKRWYWRAASQNFPKARERLEDLRKGGAAKQKTRVSRSHMKKQSDGECIIM